jgi:aminoglycoside 3-N-acetyltransferase
MSEYDVIQASSKPVTRSGLVRDLQALGVEPGMVLIVHSSLSALGWVAGGPVAVILALEDVLRTYGTLVMPTHTGHLSDPGGWVNPAVPDAWWDEIRSSMPAFDPDLTPSRGMGQIPECFRKQREVLRSNHPHFSFAAWGEQAAAVTDAHPLEYGLGEESPLGSLYALDAWVLLLGVGYEHNTSVHLAEYRARYGKKYTVTRYAPVMRDGHRRWKPHEDINIDSDDFAVLGREFQKRRAKSIRTGTVGQARAELFPQRACVDFAVRWMERNRR